MISTLLRGFYNDRRGPPSSSGFQLLLGIQPFEALPLEANVAVTQWKDEWTPGGLVECLSISRESVKHVTWRLLLFGYHIVNI